MWRGVGFGAGSRRPVDPRGRQHAEPHGMQMAGGAGARGLRLAGGGGGGQRRIAGGHRPSAPRAHLLRAGHELADLRADIDAVLLSHLPDLHRGRAGGLNRGLSRHNALARARVPTSLMRLSSSSRGFSNSRVVMFCARSVAGPKRDRMEASHSLPRPTAAAAASPLLARAITREARDATGRGAGAALERPGRAWRVCRAMVASRGAQGWRNGVKKPGTIQTRTCLHAHWPRRDGTRRAEGHAPTAAGAAEAASPQGTGRTARPATCPPV
jgi:hypothetical protein